jgi:hypothetical protein
VGTSREPVTKWEEQIYVAAIEQGKSMKKMQRGAASDLRINMHTEEEKNCHIII